MADQVNASFLVAGDPMTTLGAWRANPPPFLDGYQRIDESYESLVYESDVTTAFTKLVTFGAGRTLYRMTFTFQADPANPNLTRVSTFGQAPEDTVRAMGDWATANAPS